MIVFMKAPIWVWPLFVVLVIAGLRATRQREVSRALVIGLPVLMFALSLIGVATTFGTRPVAFGGWLAGFAIALLASRARRRNATGRLSLAPSGRIATPGSWTPLILMMIIFWSKFLVGVVTAIRPDLAQAPVFIACIGAVSGACSGLFVARVIEALFLIASGEAGGPAQAQMSAHRDS